MPRLLVLAGPSATALVPISDLVNTSTPYTIKSHRFHGQIIVNIKGFNQDSQGPNSKQKGYFARPDRQGITWSIQVQGRFLTPFSADDVLFGNTFDRPLKLPWGSGAALKFMTFIDPVLEHDLSSHTQPWALSPLIATMPHFAHHRLCRLPNPSTDSYSLCSPASSMTDLVATATFPFPPPKSITDDLSQLHEAVYSPFTSSSTSSSSLFSLSGVSTSSTSSSSFSKYSRPPFPSPSLSSSPPSLGFTAKAKNAAQKLKGPVDKTRKRYIDGSIGGSWPNRFAGLITAADRRAHFSSKANREAVMFGPQDLLTMDFCYGFLEFAPQLALALPGGISFDLKRYWDGQPVRFVCCERKSDGYDDREGAGTPWGRTFWCVVIELEE